jgi:Neuraminidase (sialidase)
MKPVFVILLFGFLLTAFAQEKVPVTFSASVDEVSSTLAPKKETAEKWDQELLRDPFWPVGYFPPDWQKKTVFQSETTDLDGSGWKAAASKIQISGTSRLGGRAAAIINGELKSTGEQVEILHEGKTYQWQIVEMDAEGRIQLKKLGIR